MIERNLMCLSFLHQWTVSGAAGDSQTAPKIVVPDTFFKSDKYGFVQGTVEKIARKNINALVI